MTLHHFLRAAVQQQAAGSTDDYFKNVSLLLTGDGTNGAQNNTFLDSSTNNFTITRNGNTTQGTFSPYGSLWSNYFDGSGDYLTAPDNAAFSFGSTGDFTVECFAYFNSTSASVIAGYSNSAGNYQWLLTSSLTSAGKIQFYITTGSGSAVHIDSTTSITTGQWYHIAVVRNGSTLRLFVNGVQEATITYSGTPRTPSSSPLFYVGQYGENSTYFNGYISNLRVVKGTAVYTSNFTPSATPLTAVSGTSILTCQSNRFIDNSSNNFAITVNGDTKVTRFSPFNPTAPYSASTICGSGYFDGTGDYLTAGSSISLSGDLTVEAWVYAVSWGAWGGIYLYGLGTDSTSSGATFFLYQDGGIRIYTNGSNKLSGTGGKFTLNEWVHVAWVRSSGTVKSYVNGIQIDSASWSSTISGLSHINAELNSGTTYPGGACYISNLRVVTSAVYTSNFTPPTAPLTAISGTSLLTNFTNAGIPDAAMQNDLETVGNAQVSTSVKKYGTGSLAFDGTGDYLQAPVNPNYSFGTGNFTIEWWVYVNSWTATASTAVRIAGSSDWVCQYNDSGVLKFYNGATTVVTDTGSPSTSTWTHFAIVRNGTTVTLYRDGTSRATATHSSSVGATNVLLVGCGGNSDNTAYCLNGYIDDLRITKGYARYTANFTPPTAALPTY